jgi:hypothetical protein
MKRILAISVFIFLHSACLIAQDIDPVGGIVDPPVSSDLNGQTLDEDPIGTDNREPGDIPVDGGLSLLLAAGAAYGARRLRRRAVE